MLVAVIHLATLLEKKQSHSKKQWMVHNLNCHFNIDLRSPGHGMKHVISIERVSQIQKSGRCGVLNPVMSAVFEPDESIPV